MSVSSHQSMLSDIPEERKSHLHRDKSLKKSIFHTEEPQILCATVRNSVFMKIWPPRFVNPWTTLSVDAEKRSTGDQIDLIFFFCGAATQRGSWPPLS